MSDRHLTWPQRIWKQFNVNRVSRMRKHYVAIKSEVRPKTQKEKDEVEYFTRKFDEYYRRTIRLMTWRLIIGFFAYASVIVTVMQDIILLEIIADYLEEAGNLISSSTLISTTALSSVFIVIFIWLQIKINLHVELMNESLTHLITLYHKNSARKTDKVLKRLSRTL